MKITLSLILSLVFIYINYKIIRSDLISQKIPNKQLLYLLLLTPIAWYFSLYIFTGNSIQYWDFITQIVGALCIGFLLFYFKIWGAGDAKYLITLGVLIPHISILWFIINIFLITLTSIVLSFIIFWVKQSVNLKHIKKTSIEEKVLLLLKGKSFSRAGFQLSTYLLYFLLFFSVIRIIRIYIIENFQYLDPSYELLFSPLMLLLITLGVFLLYSILYVLRHPLYHSFTNRYIRDGKNIYILRFTLIFILCIFLYWEYRFIGVAFVDNIKKILSIYLIIYVLIRLLLSMYKSFCLESESTLMPIKELKKGMIIEKKASLLPLKIYKKIHRSIGTRDISLLKRNKVSHVYVRKTFSFGPYILGGFICTLLFQDSIVKYLYGSVKVLLG